MSTSVRAGVYRCQACALGGGACGFCCARAHGLACQSRELHKSRLLYVHPLRPPCPAPDSRVDAPRVLRSSQCIAAYQRCISVWGAPAHVLKMRQREQQQQPPHLLGLEICGDASAFADIPDIANGATSKPFGSRGGGGGVREGTLYRIAITINPASNCDPVRNQRAR